MTAERQRRLAAAFHAQAEAYMRGIDPGPLLKPIVKALLDAYSEGLLKGSLLVLDEMKCDGAPQQTETPAHE